MVLSVLAVPVLRLNQGFLCLQIPGDQGHQGVLSLHLYLGAQAALMLQLTPMNREKPALYKVKISLSLIKVNEYCAMTA